MPLVQAFGVLDAGLLAAIQTPCALQQDFAEQLPGQLAKMFFISRLKGVARTSESSS